MYNRRDLDYRSIKAFTKILPSSIMTMLTAWLLIAATPAEAALLDSGGPGPLRVDRPTGGNTITITAIGDLLMHLPIVNAARTPLGGYDFKPLFAPIAGELRRAELTLANLETTLAGADRTFSGYPRFNTPDQIVDAARWAGIDVLTTANNHALDTGASGLERTLAVIKSRRLYPVGTRTGPDEQRFIVLNVRGVHVAILSYTYGTNGIPLPTPYAVNLIDPGQIIADVQAAHAAEADLIIVTFHWGNEYQRHPSAEQHRLAQLMADIGVDAVIATHPHVVQPFALLERADDFAADTADTAGTTNTGAIRNGTDVPRAIRQRTSPMPVFYSTGNFVSNQRERYKDTGIIAHLRFRVERARDRDRATVQLDAAGYETVWVHRYRDPVTSGWRYRVLPTALPVAGGQDHFLTSADLNRITQAHNDTEALLGPRRLFPPRLEGSLHDEQTGGG